jgi:hypothetical protein
VTNKGRHRSLPLGASRVIESKGSIVRSQPARPGARICQLTRHCRRGLANRLTRSAANNISVGRNGRINVLSAPGFYVVPGSTVKRMIEDNEKQVFDAVEADRLHGSGNTLNPDSYFLRYPDRPGARISCCQPMSACGSKKRHQMDIEFPGKQGQQLSPSVGSADSKRSQDRLSASLYREIVNQCYAHCRLCRVGDRAYFPQTLQRNPRRDRNLGNRPYNRPVAFISKLEAS